VTEPVTDAERIAALLDGRLDERQRAEVMALLATSDDAFQAFIAAAAVLPESGGGAAVVGAIPRRRWRTPAILLAAAGLVVAAIGVPIMRGRLKLANGVATPAGWDGTPWETTRGTSASLSAQARAVRVGARLVDLQAAIGAGDSTPALIAGDIIALLTPLPASAPIVAVFRDITRPDATAQDRALLLARGRPAAAQLAGQAAVADGAWLEAARLAAARHDAAFFDSSVSRDHFARLAPILHGNPEDSGALGAARVALGDHRAADWAALERALSWLLREMAS
jgi:hypothetical protein